MTQTAQQDVTANWKPLYLTGGIAALLAVFVFRRNLGAELSLLAMFGMVDGVPTTPLTSAGDWFRLFQENRLVALTTLIFLPAVYWIPHPVSAPFRVVWYFLIALRLFKLGNEGKHGH